MVPHAAAQYSVTITAPAVQRTSSGLEGVLSYITVYTQEGSGHIYIDTWPLVEVDIQGSARLAVRTACEVVGKDWKQYDFFITVRSDSPIIGGPSAGGAMTVAVIAALENWELSQDVVMSGTINPDETVGPVGGLYQKAEAAAQTADVFLVPEGQSTIMVEEQEQVQVGPFTYITTSEKEVNLVEEGKKMGIEVKEVYDIRDAVYYFTGKVIEQPQTNGEPINTDFMKSYTQKELEETQKEYTTTAEKVRSYTGKYKDDLEDLLGPASEEIENAEKANKSGEYYTSMNASFVAGLYINYVDNLYSYFTGETTDEIFAALGDYLNQLQDQSRSENPHGMTALQCTAAAQKRIFEALNSLQQGQEKEDLDYIYYASYAERRGENAEFWLNLSKEYQKGDEITDTTLESAASSMMNTAQLSLVYASSILPKSNVLQDAQNSLEKAEDEFMDTAYAASLFSALQSKVYSEVALIAYTTDQNITSRVQRARERASSSIESSRKQGIEPVLAVTYYELAQSLDSPIESLMYLRYAEEIASIDRYVESEPEVPGEPAPVQEPVKETEEGSGKLILFLVVGIFVGIGISLVAARMRH